VPYENLRVLRAFVVRNRDPLRLDRLVQFC
jgi:hypothetical protein